MTRRGRGEGSVFKRVDGRWCAVVSAGYGPAGRKRKYIYGRTRKEVAEKMNSVLVKVQVGEDVSSDGRLTVGQWLQRWLELPTRRKPQTMDTYRYAIHKHLIPSLGRIRLVSLAADDIDSYKRIKRNEGLSNAAMRVHLFCLSSAIEDAQARGLVPRGRNPVRWSGWLPKPKGRQQFFDLDSARAFLEACHGHTQGPIATFMLCTGMRIAEAVALRLSDVDAEQNFVTISRQVIRIRGQGSALSDPKSRSSRRTVALVDLALNALEWQSRIRNEQATSGRGRRRWEDQGFVFTSSIGTPIDKNIVRSGFAEILQRAGLDHCRVHDLRHSFGSLLLSQGVPLKVISEMLGHSSIAVTADVYLGVAPELQREAAVKLGSLLAAD